MSAAASRRQLHTLLYRLRLDSGLTQTAVARTHEWSPSKVHRIEKGTVSVGKTDLLALLDDYGVVDPAEREHLVELARQSRNQEMPFAGYRDVFSPETIRFLGYESSASWIGELELLVIPGLLQLPEYTTAFIQGTHGVTGPSLAKIVDSRRERQAILAREEPPTLSFLLDETILWRTVGGRDTMATQLAHLVDVASRPNINIQILPPSLGAHVGLRGPFVYLQFKAPNDPDVVYMENRRGDSIFENDAEVTGDSMLQFHDLEGSASRADELGAYVERAIDRLKG